MRLRCDERESMLDDASTEKSAGAASNPVRGPSQSSCDGTFGRINTVDLVVAPFFSMENENAELLSCSD